jgi:hypothetical protein
MRLLLIPLAAGALLLSGCATSTIINIDSAGVVDVETAVDVPKALAALPPIEASTREEFDAWVRSKEGGNLGNNEFLGGGVCTTSENADNFSLSCSQSGGVSTLNNSVVKFSRTDLTVVVTVDTPSISEGGGLVPSQLVSARASITLPGTLDSVTGGAVEADGDTVTMDTTDATSDTMTGTFTLASDPGSAFPVTVTMGTPQPQTDSRNWAVNVTAGTEGVAGAATIYACANDNEVDPMAQCTVLGSGLADQPIAVTLSPGRHYLASRVVPDDWWTHDVSTGTTTVQVQSLRARIQPRIVGDPRPGKVLRVAIGRWSPEPTAVHYRWVRPMTTNDGPETLVRVRGGFAQGYRVTQEDVGRVLQVRVTMRSPGLPARSVWLTAPIIESR